jgi:DNA-binding NarL/FixJ family response regulator
VCKRLLIVDDHEVVRLGVRRLLAAYPCWDICGEAANGQEALEKVKKLSPDAVILDLSMPVMNGFEAALQIRRIAPLAKIVFFTTHQMPVGEQFQVADAFVTKACAAQDLNATLERVLHAERQVPPA